MRNLGLEKGERIFGIYLLCGIIIMVIITLFLDDKFNLEIKEALFDFGARENYMHSYTFFYWFLLVIFGGIIIGGILFKIFEYISNLFNKMKGGE